MITPTKHLFVAVTLAIISTGCGGGNNYNDNYLAHQNNPVITLSTTIHHPSTPDSLKDSSLLINTLSVYQDLLDLDDYNNYQNINISINDQVDFSSSHTLQLGSAAILTLSNPRIFQFLPQSIRFLSNPKLMFLIVISALAGKLTLDMLESQLSDSSSEFPSFIIPKTPKTSMETSKPSGDRKSPSDPNSDPLRMIPYREHEQSPPNTHYSVSLANYYDQFLPSDIIDDSALTKWKEYSSKKKLILFDKILQAYIEEASSSCANIDANINKARLLTQSITHQQTKETTITSLNQLINSDLITLQHLFSDKMFVDLYLLRSNVIAHAIDDNINLDHYLVNIYQKDQEVFAQYKRYLYLNRSNALISQHNSQYESEIDNYIDQAMDSVVESLLEENLGYQKFQSFSITKKTQLLNSYLSHRINQTQQLLSSVINTQKRLSSLSLSIKHQESKDIVISAQQKALKNSIEDLDALFSPAVFKQSYLLTLAVYQNAQNNDHLKEHLIKINQQNHSIYQLYLIYLNLNKLNQK